jgi:hypothetical protein
MEIVYCKKDTLHGDSLLQKETVSSGDQLQAAFLTRLLWVAREDLFIF